MSEQLTKNFKRSEFACKCGCGFDDIDLKLVNIIQIIRDEVGPIRISSGCRCEKRNAEVKGVKGSFHTKGKAADLISDKGSEYLDNTIQRLYNEGKLKGLKYCIRYIYKNFCHVDIGESSKRKSVFAISTKK